VEVSAPDDERGPLHRNYLDGAGVSLSPQGDESALQ